MIKNVIRAKIFCILLFFVVKNSYASNFNSFNQNVKNYNQNLSIFDKKGQKVADFMVAIADNDEKRLYGLMNLPEMPAKNGMLFVFDEARMVKMWMKDTLIALDMVFIRGNRVVAVKRGARPLDLKVISSERAVDRVLEVNSGAALAVGIGDLIKIK